MSTACGPEHQGGQPVGQADPADGQADPADGPADPAGGQAGPTDRQPGPTVGQADPDDGQAGPAADVGRWFSTAAAPTPLGQRRGPSVRGAPRVPAWGPVAGAGYGAQSPPEQLEAALDLLRDRPTAVLTGAGMSTGSGLPD